MQDRKNILETAMNAVVNDRAKTHGDASDVYADVANLGAIMFGNQGLDELDAHDMLLLMILVKLSRIKHGNFNLDDYVDICGYASLAGEEVQKIHESAKRKAQEHLKGMQDAKSC